jgi:hypothetical protein
MNLLNPRPWRAAIAAAFILILAGLVRPTPAWAQYGAPDLSSAAIGERYHIELSGTLWNPDLFGVISSEQFGQVGSQIDFLDDLGYVKTRFKDMRIVLRPSKKSKFRIQYTPLVYEAETTFRRNIVFNGISFPVAVPIESSLSWKVWRFGYEYDFLHRSRGYLGLLIDVRHTTADARLRTNSPIFSPALSEFATIKAPLPALGLVGRVYPHKQVAINFEFSGMKVPDVDPQYAGDWFDWDLSGTVNLTNNFGLQAGWRKMTTFVTIEKDLGDVRFQGLWFGAAVRY